MRGRKRNTQVNGTAKRVEVPENVLAWAGTLDAGELDVHEHSRNTYLMREWCGLTNSRGREGMRENDIRSGLSGHGFVDPQRQLQWSSAHVLRSVSCELESWTRSVVYSRDPNEEFVRTDRFHCPHAAETHCCMAQENSCCNVLQSSSLRKY